MVTTEELQRGLSTLNEVSAESTMDWDAADRTTQGMGDSHADLPADVYCNYHSGHALCLAKIPDSDFVDIFHHNFAKKSTKSCGVSTFPSFEPDGEALSRLPGENEKAWEKAMKQLKGKKSWQAPADQELLNQFRHLIFHTCDIEIEGTSFGVTALYIKPMEDQKLSVAFFTEPEKVAVVWEFERHELVVPGHQRTYISMDPPFEVELAHKRAKVTVAGERIQGVVFTRKNIFTLPGESYRSKNQILCFRFSWTTEAIAVMKYGEKWAFMMSEKETT
ncbi:hypothetical protein Pmar_PMAR009252 [Perkinsus marinus ATCC 50983]|uniref:Uncharacterized protein n=1 Tax=Perkinsus marinus (strain ATCC 50983 / TXsc) TaxID=423536 RepID=C5M0E6_PERM5|nr:hypothetical protein Pmar_PMAR009252 [Perkinsus marinus ATCC 50983]EEQ97553.1 hypothetical protein Pmar_PMAR009252 [Perkinsus marinus ATCC 50983]|eukprot:XP_002764836.1 hypothetical protein Pmar_PMAR009252 [Perkinsus marinus ATCC 50983]